MDLCPPLQVIYVTTTMQSLCRINMNNILSKKVNMSQIWLKESQLLFSEQGPKWRDRLWLIISLCHQSKQGNKIKRNSYSVPTLWRNPSQIPSTTQSKAYCIVLVKLSRIIWNSKSNQIKVYYIATFHTKNVTKSAVQKMIKEKEKHNIPIKIRKHPPHKKK